MPGDDVRELDGRDGRSGGPFGEGIAARGRRGGGRNGVSREVGGGRSTLQFLDALLVGGEFFLNAGVGAGEALFQFGDFAGGVVLGIEEVFALAQEGDDEFGAQESGEMRDEAGADDGLGFGGAAFGAQDAEFERHLGVVSPARFPPVAGGPDQVEQGDDTQADGDGDEFGGGDGRGGGGVILGEDRPARG